MLRIGISPCYLEGDPDKKIFNGRPFLFLEESFAHFAMSQGALCSMFPSPLKEGASLADMLDQVDGLLLQGGVDVCPETYQETPLKDEWAGDPYRDSWETKLVCLALQRQMPVLGICRGMQVINVSLGGSLWQDLDSMIDGVFNHRNATLYEKNEHPMRLSPDGYLRSIYPDQHQFRVNSVHHQAVKKLGQGLQIDATSVSDGVIEAISLQCMTKTPEDSSWCVGVQWHPEFQTPEQKDLICPQVLLRAFMKAMESYALRTIKSVE